MRRWALAIAGTLLWASSARAATITPLPTATRTPVPRPTSTPVLTPTFTPVPTAPPRLPFVITVSMETSAAQAPLFLEVGCEPPGGDVNGDGRTDTLDSLFLINFLFASGPPPPPAGRLVPCAAPKLARVSFPLSGVTAPAGAPVTDSSGRPVVISFCAVPGGPCSAHPLVAR